VRVVLAEGLSPLRSGLTRLLTAYGFDVLAAAGTGPELRDALTRYQPTVVVTDVRLPPGDDEGLASVLAARREEPGLPVLLLTHQPKRVHVRELLADGSGAIGYLLKNRVAEDNLFVEAIRRVAAGGIAMDPMVVALLLTTERERPKTLTQSERDVFALIAEGRSYAAIAQRLFLSASAVIKHAVSLFGKLGLEPSQDENVRALAVLGYLIGTPRNVPH
jgi:DNA-binding NarL/FixJ family response regulator